MNFCLSTVYDSYVNNQNKQVNVYRKTLAESHEACR